MGRPLRIEYPCALYHITSRGNEKRNIFFDDLDRIKFLGILEEYHNRYGILIHSYALMNNHYHLLMETPLGNLLKVMQGLNGAYTGYFNRRHNRFGHLFQGRYKGILVDKESYLLELSRYVHLNPVRANIVKNPTEYKWSSCSGFFGKNREVKWVEYAWILSLFGRNKEDARKEYWKFLHEEMLEEVESPLNKLYGQIILGTTEFIEKTKNFLTAESISREIVERKRLKDYPKPEDVIKAVSSVFCVSEESLKRKCSRDNRARKVAIYLIKRYSGLGNQEIGDWFGGMHYSSVSKLSSRLEETMASDENLSELVKEVMSNVKT